MYTYWMLIDIDLCKRNLRVFNSQLVERGFHKPAGTLSTAACYMQIKFCREIYQLTAPNGREINNDLVNAFMIIGEETKCCTYLVVLRDKLIELFNALEIV